MPRTTEYAPATPAPSDTVLGNAGGVTALFTMSGLKSAMGLSNVENTALSTWAGSTNLTTIADGAVTLPKMANLSQGQLIGRYAAGAGAPQVVTLGSGLSLDPGTGELTAPGGSSGSFQANGSGSVVRSMQDKVREYAVSILDFGGDKTGVADCTTALQDALASGAKAIFFPAGTYRFNSTILINKSVEIYGEGREHTHIRSYVSGNNHGMRIVGDVGLGRSNLITLRDFDFEYLGAGQTAGTYWCGVFIQRKVIMRNVYVHGFTNDGGMFAPSNADVASGLKGTISNAPFFSYLENCWFKDNGRNGFWCRMGANANTFVNCQFDRNGQYGFRHYNDGTDDNGAVGSTYGNIVIGGQASYNTQYGWFLENGTNFGMYWCYGEWNGSPTNTDSDGYTNTPYDFYVGDNLSRSWIQIGVLFNADSAHVRMPSANSTLQVWSGGFPLSTHIPKRAATFGSISSPDATDLASVIALANELKADFNTMRTNARAANLFA